MCRGFMFLIISFLEFIEVCLLLRTFFFTFSCLYNPKIKSYILQFKLQVLHSYLTVGKHSGIVTLKAALDQLVHAGLVDEVLL